MNTVKVLAILLALSLGANFWLIWRSSSVTNSPSHVQNASMNTSNAHQSSEQQRSSVMLHNAEGNSLRESEQTTQFNKLQTLFEQGNFDDLEYEVTLYLRQYPEDTRALLLEAEAYFHTKPLNTALIHAKGLLALNLSPEQSTYIREKIAVNTTRVIQQFSGDGAWDLLASFLEPLIQVDPNNQTYLLPLARAYGMQSQITLMESVLANFPADFPRAQRVRDEVLTRLVRKNNNPTVEERAQSEVPDKRRVVAELTQYRGHFLAETSIDGQPLTLLVDTGASTTAISDKQFAQLNSNDVQYLGVFNINTAGGNIQAPLYKVRQLTLGEVSVVFPSVLVLPEDNLSDFDGLLGMNVLSQFNIVYDANQQTMRLYEKP